MAHFDAAGGAPARFRCIARYWGYWYALLGLLVCAITHYTTEVIAKGENCLFLYRVVETLHLRGEPSKLIGAVLGAVCTKAALGLQRGLPLGHLGVK